MFMLIERGLRALTGTLCSLLAAGVLSACSVDSSESASDPGPSHTSSREAREAAAAASERPQIIVLISIDTVRADHLGLYGYERFTSPVLDSLAREGTVFEDASATAPWTLPSHASILTGQFPLRHGVMTYKTRLASTIPTLTRVLSQAGFETAAVVNTLWLKKKTYRLTNDFDRFAYVETPLGRRKPNFWVTDQAIKWIDGRSDRPLFVFMHYFDVHSDYASEESYERLFVTPYEGSADGTGWQLMVADFEEEFIEWCHTDFDPKACTFGNLYTVDESVEKIHFDAEDILHIQALYDAGIRQIDTELSRFFAWLHNQGLMDETLLVITSDHGEEFMEHGHFEHFLATYQEVLHIPLIFRGKGVPEGLRIAAPVSSVDIMPTVLGLAKVPVPPSVEGLDLGVLWREGESQPFEDRFLYAEASGGLTYDDYAKGFFPIYRSVRRGRHKLVYESKGKTHALYDLDADPHERSDISATEPRVLAQLMAEMQQRYEGFSAEPEPENRVELDQEEIDQLRALGYVP
jgi:arylsulfatase A-like enzyme